MSKEAFHCGLGLLSLSHFAVLPEVFPYFYLLAISCRWRECYFTVRKGLISVLTHSFLKQKVLSKINVFPWRLYLTVAKPVDLKGLSTYVNYDIVFNVFIFNYAICICLYVGMWCECRCTQEVRISFQSLLNQS